jgi:iron complex transport system substrate-binding protein
MPSDHTPQRIVCLQPSATIILAEIGKLDRVVACTKYCAELLRLLELLPGEGSHTRATSVAHAFIVADSWTAKSEQILAARPDLVIAAVPYQEKAIAEIMKSGARFLGLAPKSLADIYTDIAVIAAVMDAAESGERVIAKMQQEIESVRARARNSNPPRVFCEEWGKPVITSQKWVAELVEAAGGQFIGQPGAQTLAESVLDENPDIMIAAWCGAGDRVPLEKIIRDRRWDGMGAVLQGRVFCIRDEYLNTPAPTLIHGLRALAAAIHPERFPQVSGLRCMATQNKVCVAPE